MEKYKFKIFTRNISNFQKAEQACVKDYRDNLGVMKIKWNYGKLEFSRFLPVTKLCPITRE